jgi:general secretion pathway protein G
VHCLVFRTARVHSRHCRSRKLSIVRDGHGQRLRRTGSSANSRIFLTCHRIGGFTLLELLVVIVIIGLLASYVGPKYFGQIGKAEVKVARAQIDAMEKAVAQYRLDVGRFPSSEIGLNGLVAKPANEPKWAGPYLSKGVPLDPWGNSYVYKCCPGEHGDFDLYSLGKDGAPGGTGEAADITNWSS